MILLMRNTVNEFVPGCDYTVVRIDPALIESIAARKKQLIAMKMADASLAEVRFWDASPECIGSLDPEAPDIEDALERGDGWAVVEDDALGSFDAASADSTQMVIVASDSPIVAWAYRVGSEPIRTIDVPLADLKRRLSSPR